MHQMMSTDQTSYLEVEANGRSCHQVVEMLVEIPAEDILRQGLIGVKRLLLYTNRIIQELILTNINTQYS